MISKEKFVKYINTYKDYIEKTVKFTDAIEIAFDGYLVFQLDDTITAMIIELLELHLNDNDKWIDYFIYELDFGNKYEDGMVKLENGNNVDLSSSEKLYDALLGVLK